MGPLQCPCMTSSHTHTWPDSLTWGHIKCIFWVNFDFDCNIQYVLIWYSTPDLHVKYIYKYDDNFTYKCISWLVYTFSDLQFLFVLCFILCYLFHIRSNVTVTIYSPFTINKVPFHVSAYYVVSVPVDMYPYSQEVKICVIFLSIEETISGCQWWFRKEMPPYSFHSYFMNVN